MINKSNKRTLHQLTSFLLCSLIWISLTLEAGTDVLSQNVGAELPLYTALYLRRTCISHDDLVMQALVWLCMIRFRVIWFSASRANLR